jgi:hypothetical protein
MASIPNAPELGNVVSQNSGSAQERYYNFMLMKAKLEVSGADAARQKKLIGSLSEKEEIEQEILMKLSEIKESSPEFAQVSEITGSTDKFEMARELASLVYDKARAENILSFYTPGRTKLDETFLRSQASSSKARLASLSAGAAGGSVAERIATFIGGAFA